MSNNPNQPNQTNPNTLKLGLPEKAMLAGMAVGGFFGIAQGGAHKVGAELGEPIDHGAHEAITTTTAVLKGAGEGVVDTLTDNTPPANAGRDQLNKDIQDRYNTPEIH